MYVSWPLMQGRDSDVLILRSVEIMEGLGRMAALALRTPHGSWVVVMNLFNRPHIVIM